MNEPILDPILSNKEWNVNQTSSYRPFSRQKTFWLLAPALAFLVLTTQLPFLLTIVFSFHRWQLTDPLTHPWVGFKNYFLLLSDPIFLEAIFNSVVMMVCAGGLTILLGWLLALLLNRPFFGRSLLQTLLVSPFFITPVVTAVVWKNMLLNPVFGFFSYLLSRVGVGGFDWLSNHPRLAIIMMVTWEWTPFAMLILLTTLQSLSHDELEAARLDGANPVQEFFYIIIPHCGRALEVIVLLETIFLLQIHGEIFVATSGGPGYSTTNIPFFIYQKAFAEYNIGFASAASVIATLITNIAILLMIRILSKGPRLTPKFV